MSVSLLLLAITSTASSQFSRDCPKLQQSEIGDTNAPTSSGFLAEALSSSSQVQLLQFNVVCLVQGSVNGTYRSTSVIVTYMEEGGTETLTTQLNLQCVDGSPSPPQWSTMYDGSTADASSDTTGDLTTALRTDCFLCVDPDRILGGAQPSDVEHCLGKAYFYNYFAMSIFAYLDSFSF